MKINCGYCNSSMEATSERCPFCGGINEKASQYANLYEEQKRAERREQRNTYGNGYRNSGYNSNSNIQEVRKKVTKIVLTVYGSIVAMIMIPIIIGVFMAFRNFAVEGRNMIDHGKQMQQDMLDEQRRQAEELEQQKIYDAKEVSVSGLNTIAQKDQYYAIQVTELVPYELNYDHNKKVWGEYSVEDPLLFDSEHRLAIHITVKNFQEKAGYINDPSAYMKLFIDDENENSIVILDDKFLYGDSDDNYFQGGKKISDTKDFINNYSSSLEKNQTMSWWVPVVVNEESNQIILHFNHNITITVDNPCAK